MNLSESNNSPPQMSSGEVPAPEECQVNSAELQKDQEILELRRELQEERDKNSRLEERVSLLLKRCAYLEGATAEFSIEKFKDSDDDVQFYTGLPCYADFRKLLNCLKPGSVCTGDNTVGSRKEPGRPPVLSIENQLFLALVTLRLGLSQKDVGHRFNIHQSTVSRIFNEWINLFHRLGDVSLWASRDVLDKLMPQEFKKKHSSTTVVIDATEIKCEVPSSGGELWSRALPLDDCSSQTFPPGNCTGPAQFRSLS